MATAKKQTSIRLTDEGRELLESLARRFGIAQTAVMEMAVRELARKEGASKDKAE